MPVSLRTAVDTSLPANEALLGLLRPGTVPGRKILRHDPAEVVYTDAADGATRLRLAATDQEDAEVMTHLVLLQARAVREAQRGWLAAADEEDEEAEKPEGDRLTGHVVGPFGEVWFTLRAVEGAGRTRLELEGSYEPKGMLLRLSPKRSARQLIHEFEAGLRLALARQEGRVEGAIEATLADAPEPAAKAPPARAG